MGSGSGTATIIAAVITGTFTAIIATMIGYLLGDRRHRFERIYERRAEVVAELSKRLLIGYRALSRWVYLTKKPHLERMEQRTEVNEAIEDLSDYHQTNSLWLDPRTSKKIEAFLDAAYELEFDYYGMLDTDGRPVSAEGRKVAKRAMREILLLRMGLEDEFRAIIYPPPWLQRPRTVLAKFRAGMARIPSRFLRGKGDE